MVAHHVRALASTLASRISKSPFGLASAATTISLLLAACGTAPPFHHNVRSADPRASVPAVNYNSAVRGYISQRPVEPGSWREQNERVTPTPRR